MSTQAHQTLPIDPQRRERSAAALGCAYQFTRPAVEQTETKTHNLSRCVRAAVGAVSVEKLCLMKDGNALLTSRKSSITTEQGGKSYRKPYHAELEAKRKNPANCGRCGNANANGYRQCDKCRSYLKRHREGKAGKTVTVYAGQLAQMERRIGALEHSLAMLQLNGRLMYKRGYNTGLKTGKEIRHYHGTLPEISKQELAEINHAYDQS